MSAQVILLVGQPPNEATGLMDALNDEPFVDALLLPTLEHAAQFLDVILPDVILIFADGFKAEAAANAAEAAEKHTTLDADGTIIETPSDENEESPNDGVAKVLSFCRQLRTDPVGLTGNPNSFLGQDKHRPVLMVHSQTASEAERLQYLIDGADDTLSPVRGSSLSQEEFRVRLLVQIRRNLEMQAHPITRLPTLEVASKVLQRWINLYRMDTERSWALSLIRINHWHTYQEVYGERATAQVLQTVAELALNHICPPDFIGHATETNTFILITPAPKAQRVLEALCQQFDAFSPECYSATDRKRGYLIAQTFDKASRRVPLMSLSAGVVHSVTQSGNNYRQAFAEATHLLHQAQRRQGSHWLTDAVKLTGTAQAPAPKAPPRIVVAESDEALSLLLTATLEMQGYSVAAVQHPDALLGEVTTTPTDLVLMDVILNDTEVGWTICEHIKTVSPSTQVILLATIHDRDRALGCGADVYLPKPFDLFALFNTLEPLLR